MKIDNRISISLTNVFSAPSTSKQQWPSSAPSCSTVMFPAENVYPTPRIYSINNLLPSSSLFSIFSQSHPELELVCSADVEKR